MSDAQKLNDAVDAIRQARAQFTFDGEPLDLREYIEANEEDPELANYVDAMAHLQPGASVVFGGGAGAAFTIKRVG